MKKEASKYPKYNMPRGIIERYDQQQNDEQCFGKQTTKKRNTCKAMKCLTAIVENTAGGGRVNLGKES